MHCRLQRAAARIADRSRRQAGVSIGVVAGFEMHVGVMERASVATFEQLSVDHTGIGLQRNVPPQPVVIDAGHQRAFFRHRGFFFDNGSHVDCLLHIKSQADLQRHQSELLHHRARHVLHALGTGEFISVREEISFEAFRVRR